MCATHIKRIAKLAAIVAVFSAAPKISLVFTRSLALVFALRTDP